MSGLGIPSRAVIVLFLFSLVVGATTLGYGSPPREVPLMEDLAPYRARTSISFLVCDELPAPTAAAAAYWQHPQLPAILLEVADCDGEFGNGISEIYIESVEGAAGEYRNRVSPAKEIEEEDILVNVEALREEVSKADWDLEAAIINTLIHEFGHVFGLADAYRLYPYDCDWSVMLMNCSPNILPPQPADWMALSKIYGFYNADLFDTNGNGKLDDPEFFEAIDAWVAGEIDDALFFQIVDAWARQLSTSTPASTSTPLSTQPTSLSDVLRDARSMTLYDLSGREVAWLYGQVPHMLEIWRRTAANGIYIYVVEYQQGGNLTRMIGKVVVLH